MKYFILLALLSFQALAYVDTQFGNNFFEFIDSSPKGGDSGAPLIRRYYNSLTDHRGLLGKGWGSDLETRLEFLPGNAIAVVPYGAGRITLFESGKFAIDPSWKLPQLPEQKQKLITKLQNDKIFRYQWLREQGIEGKNDFPFGTTLQAGKEILSLKNQQWIWTNSHKETFTFNKEGKLVAMDLSEGGSWSLEYQQGKPSRLKNASRFYDLKLNSNNELESFETGQNKISYAYNKGLMTQSQDLTGKTYQYEYNQLGQIQSLKGPGVNFSYAYHPQTGKVTRATEENGPIEYNYTDKELSTVVSIKSSHGNEREEYVYAFDPQGVKYLQVVKETRKNGTTETHFNPDQRPIKVLAPHLKQELLYDEKGRISEIKESGHAVGKLIRDRVSGKVNEISDKEGKRKFSYDPAGKISSIDVDGQFGLGFSYTADGKIKLATFEDKVKKTKSLLTPVYQGGRIQEILLDGKKPVNVSEKLLLLRIYQSFTQAMAMPKELTE